MTYITRCFHAGIMMILCCILFSACRNEISQEYALTDNKPLFTLLDSKNTGVDFVNELKENSILNGLMFEFIYNGGGLATADFNNDNLVDLFFISNLKQNQIYLNKGDLKFENTTQVSKLQGGFGFPTGVTVVDINYDGRLDIYVCKSGSFGDKEVVKNELYINTGNNASGIPVFEERAADYNLDISHYSIQAAFFDYDKDGDLDMFLINYGIKIYPYNKVPELMMLESADIGERLYRNENQKFIDVTKEAGIINSQIGFGLGLGIGDLNNDGWPDVIVANDFSEKDHMYINKKDGTFKEVCSKATKHISSSSMGNEIADINNDGWLDFITVDMMSENNYDVKTSMGNMEPSLFNSLVDNGLHYQYMYNTLQLNNGIPKGSDTPLFSDIAQLSGVSRTDWSWAPLIFDMDNDGNQDLFVSNGIKRDFRNNDFVMTYREIQKHMANASQKKDRKKISWLIMEALSIMPTRERTNVFFQNNGDLTFKNMNADWNIKNVSVTNGAVYVDLDNDGDLDLVGNNMDGQAMLYENHSSQQNQSHYLQIKLVGPEKNPNGIGARILLRNGIDLQMREKYFTRGYQSSVSDIVHFGLGTYIEVEDLEIQWPDNSVQVLKQIKTNQRIELNHQDAKKKIKGIKNTYPKLFEEVSLETDTRYRHEENNFDDFKREPLSPHRLSQFGPALAVGDINGDGLDDFYVGGAHRQTGKLFLQLSNGTFRSIADETFEEDRNHEDVGAVFFDAENDGDLDLYVVSGGNEFDPNDSYYEDRFYENSGANVFIRRPLALPELHYSGSKVAPCDFDLDGDVDLFVGGRLVPGNYPSPGTSILLKNESAQGAIKFVNATQEICPKLSDIGMVSDALWIDIDQDSYQDLVIVGEWMSIKIFKNRNGVGFKDISKKTGLDNEVGWWNSLAAGDFDSDGDMDLVAGNLGLNYMYKASKEEPFEVYVKDFDNNGRKDIVLGHYEKGVLYPICDKDKLASQMPFVRAKFPTYHDFAMASFTDVFGKENLKNSLNYKATNFATCYIENLGNGTFSSRPFTNMAQFSSVNSILVEDFDNDGKLDVLVAGNFYQSEMETPRNDASYGLFLKGEGNGKFIAQTPTSSGLYIEGDVKNGSMISIGSKQEKHLLMAKNNDFLQLIKVVKLQ